MRRLAALLAVFVLLELQPGVAAAHEDPVVTVRIMCNGFNVLDMDAVMGELSDQAMVSVDRQVQGSRQIEAWVKEQMDHDLRIEITEMGAPQRLTDGYTLSWTARFSREDWRKAGVPARVATNTVAIHNGRITAWNAMLDASGAAPTAEPAVGAAPRTAPVGSGVPDAFGIPLTLIGAAAAVLAACLVAIYRVVR